MAVTPRIFISATSGDLKSQRATVAAALKKLETYAEVQDSWPPDYATVSDMLRRRIRNCDAVIHLVGLHYGDEPRDRPPGAPRRSYTQMEYHLARELKKPIYLFLLPGDFLYDNDGQSEDEEKRALQQTHRASILADPHLRSSPADHTGLEKEILSLQPLVDNLRRRLRRQRFLYASSVLALLCLSVGIAWAVLKEKEVNIRQDRDIAELLRPETIEVKLFKEIQQRRNAGSADLLSSAGGGTTTRNGLSYADALAAVADDHSLTADSLRGMLDAFAARVLADPNADAYERAIAEFHRKNFSAAISFATAAAQHHETAKRTHEAAAKANTRKAIEAWTLVGDSELESLHYEAALTAYQRAVHHADRTENPRAWTDGCLRIASIHHTLGQWKEAEALQRDVLGFLEKLNDPASSSLAVALSELAGTLAETRRLEEAVTLLRRAVAISDSPDAPDHGGLPIRLNNLACALIKMNRPTEAESLLRRALALWEQRHGPSHPRVAEVLANLAAVLKYIGRNAEAKPLLNRSIAILKVTPGENHPDYAAGLNSMAGLLQDSGQEREAEPLYRQSLAILQSAFGTQHPLVARSMSNLASLLHETGRFEEAEQLYRRALKMDEAIYGKEHPVNASTFSNLAMLLKHTKRPAEALPLVEKALALDEATLGSDHPSIAVRLGILAGLLEDIDRQPEAETHYRRALAIDERAFGENDPRVAADLNNLAGLLGDKGEGAKAEPILRRAIAIWEKTLPANHPQTAIGKHNLARLLQSNGQPAAAESLMREALVSLITQTQRSGLVVPGFDTIAGNYRKLLVKMGDTDEQARDKLQKLLETPGMNLPALEKVRDQVLKP